MRKKKITEITKTAGESGITLVAMIVTMIVMVIIAGVAVGTVTGSGTNLISRAQAAVFKAKVADIKDRLEMAKSATLIRTGGILTWDEYLQTLKEWGLISSADVKDNGDGTYTLYIDGMPFVINPDDPDFPIFDPDDPYVKPTIEEIEAPSEDNPNPIGYDEEDDLPGSGPWYVADLINSIQINERTSRTISVGVSTKAVVSSSEGQSSEATNAVYNYYIKEEGQASFTRVASETSSAEYTFDNLTQKTNYVIKVTCSTDYTMTESDPIPGKVIKLYSKNRQKDTSTMEVPEATGNVEFQYSDSNFTTYGWTKESVTVTVALTNPNYKLQTRFQESASAEGTWSSEIFSHEITAHGQLVSARLWDEADASKNFGEPAIMPLLKIDKDSPDKTAPTAVSGGTHSSYVKVKLNQEDVLNQSDNTEGSGLASVQWKIGTEPVYNSEGTKIVDTQGTWQTADDPTGTNNSEYTSAWVDGDLSTGTHTFENLKDDQAYYIFSKVTDKAGNESTSEVLTLNTVASQEMTYTLSDNKWTQGPIDVTWNKGGLNSDYTLVVQTQEPGQTLSWTTPTMQDPTTLTKTVQVTKNNTVVYARLWDGTNWTASSSVTIDKIDDKAPEFLTHTSSVNSTYNTSRIDVSCSWQDKNTAGEEGSGVKSITYYIKKQGAAAWEQTQTYTPAEQNHQFTGLVHDANQVYDIQIILTDNVDRTQTWTGTCTIGNMPDITLSTANNNWVKSEDGKEVTASSTLGTGMTIQMADDKDNTGYLQRVNNKLTIYKNNTTVYAKVIDEAGNEKAASSLKVSVIDDKAPVITTPSASVHATYQTSRITVSCESLTDLNNGGENGSGIASVTYYGKKSTSATWEFSQTYSSAQTSHTFTGLAASTSYAFQITATDGVGRTTNASATTTTGNLPDISLSCANANSWVATTTGKTVTASATVGSGMTIQMCTDDSAATASNGTALTNYSTYAARTSNQIIVHTNGKTVYGRVVDEAGTAKYAATLTVNYLDGDSPSISSKSITHYLKGDTTKASTTGWGYTATLSTTGKDGTSTITALKYKASGASSWTSMTLGSGDRERSSSASLTAETGKSGTQYLLSVTDSASHTTEDNTATFKAYIDRTDPNDTAPAISNLAATSFTITCKQEDGLSGPLYYYFSTNGGTSFSAAQSSATYNVTATAGTTYSVVTKMMDRAGNTKVSKATSTTTPEDKISGQNVSTSHYGKLVNGYTSSGWSGNWRVFYKDNSYVYLITDTAAETSYNPSSHYTTTKPTNAAWTSYCTLWNTNWKSSNANQKAGAYMMTEGNWTKYKDAAGKASFAIGAPPFEMYIASINATQSKGWTYTWTSNGYKLSGTGVDSSGYYTDSNTVLNSYNNGIYQLTNAYVWLAGPHPGGTDYLWYAYYDSSSLDYGGVYSNRALRPLVAISLSNFSYKLT